MKRVEVSGGDIWAQKTGRKATTATMKQGGRDDLS